MKGLGQTGASEQKYEQPYFIGREPLKLPTALPDVTGDAKKRETAEALMKPATVEVEIPSRLIDSHFEEEIFADARHPHRLRVQRFLHCL